MKQHIVKIPFPSRLSKEEFDDRIEELPCLLSLETKRLHDKKAGGTCTCTDCAELSRRGENEAMPKDPAQSGRCA